ncbi:hypothetical protein GCM10022380_63030 [Amycolatopsis tucumanensis]|uniref:Uncharacterized protein n=1 Tax=Amycolatopsis tucumanensis TaxID=401106 RepID=A0ABP7J7S0_9PSEU
MTTQRNHLAKVGRGTQPLVIPEPARPARTLLIFKPPPDTAGSPPCGRKAPHGAKRSPSDHPRPLSLIVFQSPSNGVKAGKRALTPLIGD